MRQKRIQRDQISLTSFFCFHMHTDTRECIVTPFFPPTGPRENTVEDFWRMVWQEHVTQIIMLTSLIEDGKVSC